jgi:uncharacterized membrane protein (DUF4010 family)
MRGARSRSPWSTSETPDPSGSLNSGASTAAAISAQSLIVLLSMSLFFGLAFERFFASDIPQRPGGIRTFPMLALAGAGGYVLAPRSGLIFAAGLAILGLWLFAYERTSAAAEQRDFVVPVSNLLAYLLGGLAVTQAPWLVVAVTVAATMLLAGRQRLHDIARTVPIEEIFTAGQFLLLVGVALPLFPDVAVAGLAELTPHRVLLAVVAVSTLSYGSYLLTRYVRPKGATLLAAVLGGLYSSTATTVVLARRSRDGQATADVAAGIVLATASMYIRLLVIVAIFDAALVRVLLVPLLGFFFAGCAAAWVVYRGANEGPTAVTPLEEPANPLQVGAAVLFAVLFIAVTLATHAAQGRFGRLGLNTLAALVGFTDIDPFVLSIAQGNAGPLPAVAQAILIAVSSNNLLKAGYAFGFGGGRGMLHPIAALIALAACSMGAALFVGR